MPMGFFVSTAQLSRSLLEKHAGPNSLTPKGRGCMLSEQCGHQASESKVVFWICGLMVRGLSFKVQRYF
jgi:hypothetical protein